PRGCARLAEPRLSRALLPRRLLPRALFSRDLGAFLSRLGQSNGNGLLAALHRAALAALSALQRSFFATAHRALDALACRLSVLLFTGLLACCHCTLTA